MATKPKLKPVELPVQTAKGFLILEWQDAVGAEHYFRNTGRLVTTLLVRNDSESQTTVTFANQHPDFEEPLKVVVPAGKCAEIGPFAARQFNTVPLNHVYFESSQTKDIKFAVKRLGI